MCVFALGLFCFLCNFVSNFTRNVWVILRPRERNFCSPKINFHIFTKSNILGVLQIAMEINRDGKWLKIPLPMLVQDNIMRAWKSLPWKNAFFLAFLTILFWTLEKKDFVCDGQTVNFSHNYQKMSKNPIWVKKYLRTVIPGFGIGAFLAFDAFLWFFKPLDFMYDPNMYISDERYANFEEIVRGRFYKFRLQKFLWVL